jgi:hypothetical protein
MSVVYPAMLPLAGTNKSTADRDALSIHLVSHFNTGAHWSVEGFIESMLAHDLWTWVARIDTEYDVYVYHRDVSRWNDKSSLVNEHLVPANKRQDRQVYFSCYRELGNLAAGCIGTATFGKEIELDFIFRHTRFEEWPEILSKVESFLKTLVMG